MGYIAYLSTQTFAQYSAQSVADFVTTSNKTWAKNEGRAGLVISSSLKTPQAKRFLSNGTMAIGNRHL